MADDAMRSPGVCAGMGTANSMHIVCEALGMALPGSAPVARQQREDDRPTCVRPGARIVQMVWDDCKPRDILTAGAFAQRRLRGAGDRAARSTASSTCRRSRTEAAVDVDVYRLFADYADKVPLLAAIRPNGTGRIEEFEAAGGARAVLKRLERLLDLDARVGHRRDGWAKCSRTSTVADERVIHTVDAPLSKRPSIVIVRGSLCCPAAASCGSAAPASARSSSGAAQTFSIRATKRSRASNAGKVKPGDVVVLRGLGVIGGPGHGA